MLICQNQSIICFIDKIATFNNSVVFLAIGYINIFVAVLSWSFFWGKLELQNFFRQFGKNLNRFFKNIIIPIYSCVFFSRNFIIFRKFQVFLSSYVIMSWIRKSSPLKIRCSCNFGWLCEFYVCSLITTERFLSVLFGALKQKIRKFISLIYQ